jgi:iron complex transport system substrate-binding protein
MICAFGLVAALLPMPILADPITVTDATGAEVTFDTSPSRIVCLNTACTHDLSVLGVKPLAVGPVGNYAAAIDPLVFGDEGRDIGILPWTDGYDLEALAALQPDLIIGWDGIQEVLPPAMLADIAPLYITYEPLAAPDLPTLTQDLVNYAAILGREAEAQAFIDDLTRRHAAYAALRPDAPDTFAVVRLFSPETGGLVAVPPGCGALMAAVASCAVASDRWQEISVEGLLALDPDLLIVEDWGPGPGGSARSDGFSEVLLWQELSAARSGRVHDFAPNRTFPYSPLALMHTLDTVLPLLYPETFPAPLTEAEVAAALARE